MKMMRIDQLKNKKNKTDRVLLIWKWKERNYVWLFNLNIFNNKDSKIILMNLVNRIIFFFEFFG